MKNIGNVIEQVSNLNEETQIHSKRVGVYTMAYCLILGLNDKESSQIAIAAMTHDLGKMHIPKEVLEKPSKLTESEFLLIKEHPEMGYSELIKQKNLLNQTPEQFQTTLNVALHHHEKFNGQGYPHQLKGNEIPFAAQVVGIVDVFDALSCERVYKKAWGQEDLMSYMKEQSGKAFNPMLVEAFIKNQELFYGLKDYIGNSNDLEVSNFENETKNYMKRNGYKSENEDNTILQRVIGNQKRKMA